MKFDCITVDKIRKEGFPSCDYHIHANYADADLEIEDIFLTAKARGLKQIAITEHIWKGASWLDEYVEKINKCGIGESHYMLIGSEVRIINMDGQLNIELEQLKRFDLVIGVIHRYPVDIDPRFYPDQLSIADAIKLEEDALIAMIKRREVHVVGHIGRALEKFYAADFPLVSLRRILKYAREYNIAVEVNTASKNALNIFKECLLMNCPMSFGTDSHLLDSIGIYDTVKLQAMFDNIFAKKIIFS